jgi:hypothetical protein
VHRLGLSPLVILWLVAAAPAQTALAWKLRPGDAWLVEHQAIQAMTLQSKAKPLQQKSTVSLRTRWQVQGVKDGSASVRITVESMRSKSSTGAGKPETASKDDALWQHASFDVLVDPQGRLRELRGYDELLKKLAAGNEARLKVLRALKPAESFQALLQEALGPLSPEPVAPDHRWIHESAETMGLFGTFRHKTEFTYVGVKDGLHRADSKITTTFQSPRYAIENDVFRVLKGEVSKGETTGHFLFDAAAGRMVHVERQGKLHGELTLETFGMPQRLRFESDSSLTIRVTPK